MKHHLWSEKVDRWTVGGLILGVLVIAGLSVSAARQTTAGTASIVKPSKVEAIEGSKVKKVTLTEEGAGRLGLQTVAITEAVTAGKAAKVIPYTALLYLPDGSTWAYVKTEPLSFVREQVTVDRIAGDKVFLSQGPPAGTQVVTVGVSELYGAETGVGK
jgi:hypothetical protein